MSNKLKISIAILLVLVLCAVYFLKQTAGVYYKTYSPDGQYSRYASAYKYLNFGPFANKLGDSYGRVYVYDELKNKIVDSAPVTFLSVINQTDWNEASLIHRGGFSIELPRKINTKIIEDYSKSTPANNSSSIYLKNKQHNLIKKGNKVTVKNKKGTTVFKNIKYIGLTMDNHIQVLNGNGDIEYYTAELHKLKEKPVIDTLYNYMVCGNVGNYSLKIEETKNYYVLKKSEGFTSFNIDNYAAIDSVLKTDVKDIYFLNKKRELKYNGNRLALEYVIIDYGSYFGLLNSPNGIQYFDSINSAEQPIKVKRDSLYGYYNLTDTEYLELGLFTYNLALFKDQNNNIGYIDRNGNKYYK